MTPTPVVTTTAESDIRDLVDAANRHQDDPDALLALHTQDTVIVNLAGLRVAGRHTFGEVMRRSLQGRLSNVRTRTEVTDITFVRADVALVSCVKHVEDTNPDADSAALPPSGMLTYVVVATGDGWRIALAQTTPRMSG